jgi:HD-GYP domain-containing protein (c-di-GMP phosphodiesterase class II)
MRRPGRGSAALAPPDPVRAREDEPVAVFPLLLLHTGGWSPGSIAGALAAERIEVREIQHLGDVRRGERPTVLVLDTAEFDRFGVPALAALVDAGAGIVLLGDPGSHDVPDRVPAHIISAYVAAPPGPRRLLIGIRAAFREAAARRDARDAVAETADRTTEVTDLTEIGIRLLTERDHDALLGLILTQARRMTRADAGSLYLVESNAAGERRLVFKVTQNDSRPDIAFAAYSMPLDGTSLAGQAALSGDPLVIDDAYALPPGSPYTFNRSFDDREGYRTKSMLVIPMPNQLGEVIGVLQLINRKPDIRITFANAEDAGLRALPFDARTISLARALAGQAAVSLENSQLYAAIEQLFEGFVTAAVGAIEQRDPTTSGHSERVASMTCALAMAADRAGEGAFHRIRFTPDQLRELRYAGLLHDFGKVGVREQVLVKAKKLYPEGLALIEQRHAYLVRSIEYRAARERAEHLERRGTDGYAAFAAELEDRTAAELDRVHRFLDAVHAANEPTILPAGDFAALEEFAQLTYPGLDGGVLPFLTGHEIRSLSIRQGSLDDDEWVEMRRHVANTYGFLSNIPWTRELRGIPAIAHGHHEKLDGSGYPRGLAGAEIPLQTRMMTVADIYDALTAADRPYKRAVPFERAIDVLGGEVRHGRLDGDVLRLFLDAKVYQAGRWS